jgi:hypothetical protein
VITRRQLLSLPSLGCLVWRDDFADVWHWLDVRFHVRVEPTDDDGQRVRLSAASRAQLRANLLAVIARLGAQCHTPSRAATDEVNDNDDGDDGAGSDAQCTALEAASCRSPARVDVAAIDAPTAAARNKVARRVARRRARRMRNTARGCACVCVVCV